jgi:2-oxoacid:acceptor oxidoreductase gamma subunit (pyruvate/2-ketoisovalerate family)/2-oxoacid:acceptor oxidoreductase delta subunit (pyruvate/2-ketoisovalerate family)
MYEVRFHGRGGQGAVMAAQLLSEAAFLGGSFAIAFPFFGAERRGAPVTAFARVDEKKIRIRMQIYHPDYVVTLDPSLIKIVDLTEGLKESGILIINSAKSPEEIHLRKKFKVATVDATKIAIASLGSPITNTAILGAFAKATKKITLDNLEHAIIDKFIEKFHKKEMGIKNFKAAERAFHETEVGYCSVEESKVRVQPKTLPTYKEILLGCAIEANGSSLSNKTGSWRTFKPIKDDKRCSQCLLCWLYCPDASIDKDTLEINYAYCKGCGLCKSVCPQNAISMIREVI